MDLCLSSSKVFETKDQLLIVAQTSMESAFFTSENVAALMNATYGHVNGHKVLKSETGL